MGVSNSENMLLSEFNFLANKPATTLEFSHECQDIISRTAGSATTTKSATSEQDQDREDRFEVLVSTLKLKMPTVDERSVLQENSHLHHHRDGFKTPTSLDHRIPAVLVCPPAPRKPKPLPSVAMKRKSTARRRVLLDVSAEIESLFPPAILADLIGGKIKKFRQGNDGVV